MLQGRTISALILVTVLAAGCSDEPVPDARVPVVVTTQNAALSMCSGFQMIGNSARTQVDVEHGSEDTVRLSISGLPSGVEADFDAIFLPSTSTATDLVLRADSGVPAVNAQVATIHANDASTTIAVTVTGPC